MPPRMLFITNGDKIGKRYHSERILFPRIWGLAMKNRYANATIEQVSSLGTDSLSQGFWIRFSSNSVTAKVCAPLFFTLHLLNILRYKAVSEALKAALSSRLREFRFVRSVSSWAFVVAFGALSNASYPYPRTRRSG